MRFIDPKCAAFDLTDDEVILWPAERNPLAILTVPIPLSKIFSGGNLLDELGDVAGRVDRAVRCFGWRPEGTDAQLSGRVLPIDLRERFRVAYRLKRLDTPGWDADGRPVE